ncbi:hypothetical protein DNM18_18085 [Salmonella enterica subsp. enterica]|nr:hypothetical protein [Salmonella enterica subsp. enterica serovar Poona]EBU7356293.1 hypothetical protein [Salmonella enterica subsp. enterica serovar Poona]ECA2556991.1 hypothetical protein [Salmonella enterica subsp. enterica serovar Poona]
MLEIRTENLLDREVKDMNNWVTAQLSDFIQFKNGRKRPAERGKIPVYGGNGILDYTDTANQENSVIIGRVGAYCGSVYYEPAKHWVSDNAISAASKCTSDIVYDYYLLKSLNLNHRHIGTSQPLLTQEILNSIVVNLPPLDEQIEIGRTLRLLDEKIVNNTAINHHLASPRLATDSSPDIRRGNKESRKFAKRLDSCRLHLIRSNIKPVIE